MFLLRKTTTLSSFFLPFGLHGQPGPAVRGQCGLEAALPTEPLVVEGGDVGDTCQNTRKETISQPEIYVRSY
jgi:hypothetical protein